jgi:hypothetical protein
VNLPVSATDQDTADACVNGIQDERTPHALLSNNCSEWKNRWHSLTPNRDYNA